MPPLARFTARAYLQPLREGGSLPAVVDTEGGMFVVKFRGAGQGPRALVAEIVVAGLAAALDLPVPEMALVEVPEDLAAQERDPEIRELVDASVGTNVGLRYLDGAFNFDPNAAGDCIDEALASAVVWLDAFTTNPDRTPRNPNLLIWERRPWLIDHGSALYAHHAWDRVDDARTRTPFPLIRDHVLLPRAGALPEADARMSARLPEPALLRVLSAVPDELLMHPLARGSFGSADEARQRYVDYLARRLEGPRAFAAEASRAREARMAQKPLRLGVRR